MLFRPFQLFQLFRFSLPFSAFGTRKNDRFGGLNCPVSLNQSAVGASVISAMEADCPGACRHHFSAFRTRSQPMSSHMYFKGNRDLFPADRADGFLGDKSCFAPGHLFKIIRGYFLNARIRFIIHFHNQFPPYSKSRKAPVDTYSRHIFSTFVHTVLRRNIHSFRNPSELRKSGQWPDFRRSLRSMK